MARRGLLWPRNGLASIDEVPHRYPTALLNRSSDSGVAGKDPAVMLNRAIDYPAASASKADRRKEGVWWAVITANESRPHEYLSLATMPFAGR